ncbi:glycosyl transferase family 2 [Helicobacter didelphidarum]|uniref:Glycosyl transferase family 2 n=1 Tax=Helicobacter didelphidarum TaxID=2040648 RepID=A0A3D8IEN4_9HELI|nr:glycosyltransferase family 2 protein [Helicobacter didelphidarum]RDU63570.1 glycosyl transferase family 2 [Helicobacter didelphidarum]
MYHKSQDEIMQHWDKSIEKPLCSVLCITYNHKNFIAQALDSMLEQETDFPFDIIIHDDCSTDGTDTIIKEYEAKYPKIIKALYEEENQYSKRENGNNFLGIMHKMAAKYIALCEGDDYWNDPKKIQIQVDFLESHQEYVLCYHDCDVLDNDKLMPGDYHKQDGSGEMMQKFHLCIPTRCACYRNVIDYFDLNVADSIQKIINGDIFVWSLLGKYGNAKYLSQIKPAIYRLHDGGVWSSLKVQERYANEVKTFFYIAEYYRNKGDSNLSNYIMILAMKSFLVANNIQLNMKDFSKAIRILLNHTNKNGRISYKLIIALIFPKIYYVLDSVIKSTRDWLRKKRRK